MPAKTRITTTPLDTTTDTLREDLQRIIAKHYKGLRSLVVERRNRGPASGPLPHVVDIERDPDESDEDGIASAVDETLAVIRRDAVKPRGRGPHPNANQIGAWQGEVVLLGDPATKRGKPKELDRLPVEIEDPDAWVPSVENETVAIMKEARLLLAGERAGLVAIYKALGQREKHQAKMFRAMASGQAALSKSSAKWRFRERREHEETERADIEARERTAKRKFFWEAIESIGVEWKDVGEIWSKYYTQGRKPGDAAPPPPSKPTDEECAKIFGGKHSEIFERKYATAEGERDLRSIVAEMCNEPDFERRRALSRMFLSVAMQIPNARDVLKAALLEHVDEARAQAIVAWLALPVTF